MTDLLLEIGARPQARKIIETLGLPIPMPQKLRRAAGPWEERPLFDTTIVAGAADGGALAGPVAALIASAGANPFVAGPEGFFAAFGAPGEAYGRPARRLDLAALPDDLRPRGLVFDASGLKDPAGLRALYDFFHPLVPLLDRSGRAVVLGRPADGLKDPAAAAAQAALDGFVRSVAKEVGKRGSTAGLILVEPGAEARLAGVLRFLLSPRSAFVSGQPFRVTAAARTRAEDGYVRALEKKVALVTGAARGIGEATARALAAEGAHVVCLDRPADDILVAAVAREIGGSVLLADVAVPDAPANIARELKEKRGGVDIAVHNAGVTRDRTLAKMTPEAFDEAIAVNLGAIVRIHAALAGALLRDGGRVIVLSSVAGIAGNVGQTNYAAAKSGLIGFVRNQAAALAPRGITVNAIAPGFIETRLTAAIPVMIREVGRRFSSLGQGGLPQDVAETIAFLATPAASGLTGGVIRVCGGAFIGA